ncbi:MAG: cell wall-binding repeat-containing protein [Peptostreptococcus sp.]|uniref:cell wall-binding repeat-containing protein n=1 Tax=Peptostreptococcus sp. TaxID=1262 RepID=UPI002FC7FF36
MKFKKIISFSLAAFIALPLLGNISNADTINVERIEGQNRYETSINVSKEIEESDYVLIASGQGYADALIGGTMASQENAPLLLTEKNKLSSGISSEIKRINPKEIYILGGEKAISKKVEKELLSLGFPVRRLHGNDRVKTAKAVSEERLRLSKLETEGNKNILQAGTYGWNFPDALVAGPFIGIYSSNSENKQINLELANLSLERKKDMYRDTYDWFFGGNGCNSGKTKYFSGKNRYETSISVADGFKNILNKNFDTIILVSGENYPDALSASVLSAKYTAPILLTPSKTPYKNIANYIKNNNIKNIIVVGGNRSVDENVVNSYAKKYTTESDTSTEILGGKIHANKESMIYHMPGQRYYGKIKVDNLEFFNSEKEAIDAGYRKSMV